MPAPLWTLRGSSEAEERIRQAEPSWKIPAFVCRPLRRRARPCAVVIPVINEGDRIVALCEKMQSLSVFALADVVIVDGGSVDGSIERLEQSGLTGIAAILTLKEPLGLSAQLRAAYAFVLLEGYQHVVTIDGNGKDDPEAIGRMVAQLERGCDFVQASRFIAGGSHAHTPWMRLVAVRCIHAPLLRLASGFAWTDTTQGFRAYSRRLLEDRRLHIFRDCFVRYELLAYISRQAPRLGFRCCEVGTTRRYPSRGKTPTKISHLRGNYRVMASLVSSCLGRYNVGA